MTGELQSSHDMILGICVSGPAAGMPGFITASSVTDVPGQTLRFGPASIGCAHKSIMERAKTTKKDSIRFFINLGA